MTDLLTYAEVVAAEERLRGGIVETSCLESEALSALSGCRLFAKAEYRQRTGSFKERGARNALLCLSPDKREKGVIAASAGNHALALAYHGRNLGIAVTVVMPEFAPLIKQSRCKSYGAEVLLSGGNIRESKLLADELVRSKGLSYVHGFDGRDVMAGAGTVGLEILRQVPDVEAILVPVGGGGLIAGLSLAVKTTHPSVQIIGVETQNAGSFKDALNEGRPVVSTISSTLADGLAVPEVGAHAFAIAKDLVDGVIGVNEESVALSILRILELEKGVVEGAGAVAIAPFFEGKLKDLEAKKVVACLCGGNIDPMMLGRVIEHALAIDGRLARFRAVISDRPGGLAKFCELVASTGASVKQITHERAFTSVDVSAVEVECIVETRDRTHVERLLLTLKSAQIKTSIIPPKTFA